MAYLLSKLLPLAVLPLGLTLSLLDVVLIGRLRWPVLTALFLLWLSSLGLVRQGLWRFLEFPGSVAPRRRRLGPTRLWCSVVDVIRLLVPLELVSGRTPTVSSPALISIVLARRPACCSPVAPAPFAPVSRRKASATCTNHGSSSSLLPRWPARHTWRTPRRSPPPFASCCRDVPAFF